MSNALKLQGISKKFTFPNVCEILKEINLSIPLGKSIAIIGSSGVGKSTLLHIAAGLEEPTEGEVTIGSELLTRSNAASLRRKHIGFVFQGFHLIESLTLLDNVLMPARIARLSVSPKSKSYAKALELIEKVGLSSRKDHPARLLSGGEKQRAAIARALMQNPSLLFADEPTGNLDSETSATIHRLLLECANESCSVVIVTHNIELAKQCDEIFCLQEKTLLPFALNIKDPIRSGL